MIEGDKDVEVVKIAARIGAELGADFVKTNYTGDPETFAKVVEGCPAPILIAGGSKLSQEQMFKTIEEAMQAGAMGVSIGRNVFQHHNPTLFVQAACSMVHENWTAEQALELLAENGA